MTDPGPMERETAPPSAVPEGAVVEGTTPVDERSMAALRRSAFRASLGLGIYTLVALGLLVWSLRRGRLSDAVLLLVAMVVALPPIVSYRSQLRRRLQVLTAGGGTVGTPPPDGIAARGTAPGDPGGAPPTTAPEAR